MEIQFPQTNAELLPFAAAGATLLFGLFAMFTPRVMLRAFAIHMANPQPQGVAEMRATLGGFYLGIGLLSLLLFDQQNIQLLLGGAWTFAAFGRLVALLSDGDAALEEHAPPLHQPRDRRRVSRDRLRLRPRLSDFAQKGRDGGEIDPFPALWRGNRYARGTLSPACEPLHREGPAEII